MPTDSNQTATIDQGLQTAWEHHQAGRLPQAEAIYQKILQESPNHPDALRLLGVIALHEGKNEIAVGLISKAIVANPSDPSNYGNLGNALQSQDKLDAAIENYHRALSIKPDYAEVHYNLGLALQAQSKLDMATESYRRAISLKPGYAKVHYNLGLVLQTQGNLEMAVESYQKAISFKPDFVEAYYNLGVALQAQDNLDAAVESYQKAISFKPDYPKAHNNNGLALQTQGNLEMAVESYQKAISFKPDFAEAHHNLGLVLKAQGKPYEAIACHQHALQLQESPENKTGFALCIKNVRFTHEVAGIRPLVTRAISEPWGSPRDLVVPCISLIKLNQGIKECINRATDAWPRRLSGQELFGSSGLIPVLNDRLLQCLLENAPVCDLELERFLTMARLSMLDTATGIAIADEPEEKLLAFYCALSRQCFTNEYVFAYTDEELSKAQSLRDQVAAAIESGSPIPMLWLVAVAAYSPLLSLPSAETLLDRSWTESVAALLVQQIREPMEELQLRTSIPRLTTVEDEVSSLVQRQYEENPYPRWVKAPSGGKPIMVNDFLRKQFHLAPFKPLVKGKEIDILVAGCGTGQHSIGTAQQFCDVQVLAIDLSLTSLSYAKRKTRELGLANIEYAQADIMKLGSISRTFDVIESFGVLHHMADPMAGWKILFSLLRPGGLMRLGLYSELARQHVVAARDFIAERGYASNAEGIRRCRQDMMAMENNMQFRRFTSSSDFYTTSACRDLIFHVQEHRYTLPQLKKDLGELGLGFIGFILDPDVMEQYRKRFPDDQSKTNLDYWYTFENENPDTFAGTYQFWVQKHG